MKTSQKGFISPLLLALIAILLVSGGVYVYVQKKQVKVVDATIQTTLPVAPAGDNTEELFDYNDVVISMTQNSDWKTYTNNKYGFSLKYPDINARLKSIGSWTDTNEPRITSRTPFNYNECASSGKGPGMSASSITIADRKYCLIIVYAVEPDTFGYQYEYVSRIKNEDIGITFSFSGNRGVSGHQVEIVEEAPLFFIQILSTLTLTTQATSMAQQENSKIYSTHPSIKAYLQGPSEITANTVWSGSVVIPQNTINVAGAPDVVWGDGSADPEWGGSPWQYDSAGTATITHTYTKSGSYTITIYINGGANVGFEQGTVVIKKTVTVR